MRTRVKWLMEDELRFWSLFFMLQLIIALLCVGWVKAEEYKTYPTGKPVLSTYTVKQQPNGDFKVYETGKPSISKYTVKKTPTGYSVYETGKPVLPLYDVKSVGEIK